MPRALSQYLDRYAEPEAKGIGHMRRKFGHVLTIPACGEGRELHAALASIPAGPLGDVLTLVVVNARVDSPQSLREANLATLERLRADAGRAVAVARNASVCEHPRGALLLVDRATPGFELPARHGVGLARKIAADIALALWSEGRVASAWIHCTDADVELPADYFETPSASGRDAALVYPFRHVEATREALEYEISLRYYVAGLRFAGSPYAYHSIGSTLAVNAIAYAQVRGFPKRLAAEDFYLLNKLAKVGAICALQREPIRLSSRSSKRTPFGTGRAIERAREFARDDAPRRVYAPVAFAYLGAWLQTLRALAETGGAADPAELLAEHSGAWPAVDVERLRARLETTGAWAAARIALERCRSPETRAKHLLGGFDAFQTLKLIHALRADGLDSIPLREALAEAPFIELRAGAPLEDVREQLAAAEPLAARLGVTDPMRQL